MRPDKPLHFPAGAWIIAADVLSDAANQLVHFTLLDLFVFGRAVAQKCSEVI